jgi:hypothetical protein
MTLSITTIDTMTFSIMTLCIIQIIVMLSVGYAQCHLCSVSDTQTLYIKYHHAECRYTKCRYAQCHGALKRPLEQVPLS